MSKEFIPCRLCGEPTQMMATELCDHCWEVDRRLIPFVQAPAARKLLRELVAPFDATDLVDNYTPPLNAPFDGFGNMIVYAPPWILWDEKGGVCNVCKGRVIMPRAMPLDEMVAVLHTRAARHVRCRFGESPNAQG